MNKDNYVSRIREFNRFYTVLLGVVDKKYLGAYSLPESRILYELRENPNCNATQIIEKLRLDKSYLSRILKKFVDEGLLEKTADRSDGRALHLNLTEKGTAEADTIIAQSNARMAALLEGYDGAECQEICAAMDTITKYFGREAE